MSSFLLAGVTPVTLTDNIKEEQLLKFGPFQTWLTTLQSSLKRQDEVQHPFHNDPYTLQSVTIQSVDWFGSNIGFVKLEAVVKNRERKLPGIAFLRGPSVAVLMILQPSDSKTERWVIMTEQPRIPTGSLRFLEIPAGMTDSAGSFAGSAAKVITEETGFDFPSQELKDLTRLAIGKDAIWEDDPLPAGPTDDIQIAMYPSCGGTDEYIKIFLWEKELERKELEELKTKLANKKTQASIVTVRIVDYEQLWRIAARDGKSLASWSLYEALKRRRNPELIDKRPKQ